MKRLLLIAVLTSLAWAIGLVVMQPGCAYAGEPLTPDGWFRVYEWKGNPVWCAEPFAPRPAVP